MMTDAPTTAQGRPAAVQTSPTTDVSDKVAYAFYAVAAAVALVGQVWAGVEHIPWPPSGFPVGLRVGLVAPAVGVIELAGVATSALADVRRRRGEKAYAYRVMSLIAASVAFAFNLIGHWQPGERYLAFGFAGLSAFAYALWLAHSSARRRDALRERRMLARTAPVYGPGQWLRAPAVTRRARALAMEHGHGLYESLRIAREQLDAEQRRSAIAEAVSRLLRAEQGDSLRARIAVATYPMDLIADAVAARVDVDEVADRISSTLRAGGGRDSGSEGARQVPSGTSEVGGQDMWRSLVDAGVVDLADWTGPLAVNDRPATLDAPDTSAHSDSGSSPRPRSSSGGSRSGRSSRGRSPSSSDQEDRGEPDHPAAAGHLSGGADIDAVSGRRGGSVDEITWPKFEEWAARGEQITGKLVEERLWINERTARRSLARWNEWKALRSSVEAARQSDRETAVSGEPGESVSGSAEVSASAPSDVSGPSVTGPSNGPSAPDAGAADTSSSQMSAADTERQLAAGQPDRSADKHSDLVTAGANRFALES